MLCLPIAPLCCPTAPIMPEAQEAPKHMGGQKPPMCFMFFKAPSTKEVCGTSKHNPRPPHATENRHKNVKTLPASSECASALPGDVSNDRVRLCARFRWRPPPGSPMGLHGEFQGCRNGGNGGYTSAARTFCARSAGYYIICIVVLVYTQFISLSIILCETSKESVVQCRGM